LRLQEIHVAHELSRWRVNITSIFSSPTFSSTWLLLLPPLSVNYFSMPFSAPLWYDYVLSVR
jgi:hypothetical protein